MTFHRRLEFSAPTKRAAYDRSNGICECHRIPWLRRPNGCGRELREGNTFYEHINPDNIRQDNSLDNAACLVRTCWREKTAIVRYLTCWCRRWHFILRQADAQKGGGLLPTTISIHDFGSSPTASINGRPAASNASITARRSLLSLFSGLLGRINSPTALCMEACGVTFLRLACLIVRTMSSQNCTASGSFPTVPIQRSICKPFNFETKASCCSRVILRQETAAFRRSCSRRAWAASRLSNATCASKSWSRTRVPQYKNATPKNVISAPNMEARQPHA